MLNIRDLRIDNNSLGSKMLLVEVLPVYAYQDGKKTDSIVGHRYVVCLPDHKLEKMGIKIDGPRQVEQPDGFVEVVFNGLEVTAYELQGKVQFSAKAQSIHPVK